MSQRTTLTPELKDQVISLIKSGVSKKAAAGAVGVNRRRFQEWYARGAQESSGIFREFHDAMDQAYDEAEARDLVLISAAAKRDWRAAAWKLEKLRPDKYGNRIAVEMKTKERILERFLEILRNALDPERYAEVLDALDRAEGEGGEGEAGIGELEQ